MPNENEQQTAKKKVYGFFANVIENTFNRGWNKLSDWSGGKIPKFTLAARTGAERLPPVKKEFGTVFQKNQDMIGKLIEIEGKWLFIENKVFPYPGGDINKDPEYIVVPPDHPEQDRFSHAITDKYREIEYFRDLKLVEYEAKMFQTGEGQTIRSKPERLILDFNKIRMNIEAHVTNLRAMASRSAQQQKDLDTCEFLLLNNADELRKLLD